MKNDIQKLLESFGENSRIGDVLEKMKEVKVYFKYSDKREAFLNPEQLLALWEPCGFTKSLQEIYAEIKWLKKCEACGSTLNFCCGDLKPKSEWPDADRYRDLFTLLLQLFPKP